MRVRVRVRVVMRVRVMVRVRVRVRVRLRVRVRVRVRVSDLLEGVGGEVLEAEDVEDADDRRALGAARDVVDAVDDVVEERGVDHLRDMGEMCGRYAGDMGEIWARCGRDMGERWGRCLGDMGERRPPSRARRAPAPPSCR